PPKRAESRPEAVPGAFVDPKEPGDTLVVLYGQEPDSLNPVTTSGLTNSFELIDNLLPQTTWSDWKDCGLTFEPFLATSWEFSPDGLSLTYRLRKDFVWDDGVPVTAADVAFSYDLFADPDIKSARGPHVRRMARPPAEALDDFTVRFRFTETYDLGSM